MKSLNGSLALIAFALAACGSGTSAPSGQVVATVDGQEVTIAELKAEMGQEPADQAAQTQALERIIARKLLAAEARKQDLDSTPLAAIVKTQAEETALAQLLARKITDGVPKVSDDEVSEFMRSFPTSVTDRRLLSVEQLLVTNLPQPVMEEIKQVKTMPAAEAILNARKIGFRRTMSNMDTMTLDPGFAQQLVSTEGTDIYILPNGSAAEIGRIVSSRPDPLNGDQARQAARAILTRQRSAEMVNNALSRVIAEGRRKVQINPQFENKASQPKTAAISQVPAQASAPAAAR